MSTDNFHGVFEEHTIVKLELYRQYLEAYLTILSYNQYVKTIEIYDLFCGKGLTDEGQEGSALIEMKLLLEVIQKTQTSKTFKIYFNDNDDRCCKELEKNVSSLPLPFNVTYKVSCIDFNLAYKEVIVNLEENEKDNSIKSMFFIDPFGYKDVELEKLLNIKQFTNSEIFLFLPISNMYRFISDIKSDSVLKIWREYLYGDNDSPVSINDFIIRISSFFSEAGYYSGYFILQNQKCVNKYAIFFISSNLLGLHRFNDAKWKIDIQSGLKMENDVATCDIPSITQGVYDTSLEFLKQNIIDEILKFENQTIDNVNLYESIIRWGYTPKHFNELQKNTNFLKTTYLVANKNRSNYIDYKYYVSEPLVLFSINKVLL